jgi:hypothetical protein
LSPFYYLVLYEVLINGLWGSHRGISERFFPTIIMQRIGFASQFTHRPSRIPSGNMILLLASAIGNPSGNRPNEHLIR